MWFFLINFIFRIRLVKFLLPERVDPIFAFLALLPSVSPTVATLPGLTAVASKEAVAPALALVGSQSSGVLPSGTSY